MESFLLNGFGPYTFEGEILMKRAKAAERFICTATESVVEISNGLVIHRSSVTT